MTTRTLVLVVIAFIMAVCNGTGTVAQNPLRSQAGSQPVLTPAPAPTSPPGNGTAYYVSPTGSDSNSGISTGSAWQSIEKVNASKFKAGDSVLFLGGSSFTGCPVFSASTNVTSSSTTNPITVASYGNGRATLLSNCPGVNSGGNGPKSALFTIDGVSGFVLENLILSGNGNNTQFGVLIQNSNADVTADTITVQNTDISDFTTTTTNDYSAEIFIVGYSTTGICGSVNNVQILNNTLHGAHGVTSADDNGVTGYSCANLTNVHYSGNVIYNLGGRANVAGGVSGNGIVANGVRGGIMEYNVAHDLGANADNCGGPAGLWAYQSDNVVIQFNEAYNIRPIGTVSSGACDWDGFDLDGSVTNSIVQYNYSHDNYGGGIITCAACGAPGPWGPNTIRYNITQNDDGQGNGYMGEIVVSSKTSNQFVVNVYNNTSYNNNGAALLDFNQGTFASGVIANNLFIQAGEDQYGQAMLVQTNHQDPRWAKMAGNAYYVIGSATPTFAIDARNYSTFGSYQSETGWDTGSKFGNPMLANAGSGGVCNVTATGPRSCPRAYAPTASSPVLGAGVDLTANPYSLSVGTQDYYGNSVPSGGKYNIGAY